MYAKDYPPHPQPAFSAPFATDLNNPFYQVPVRTGGYNPFDDSIEEEKRDNVFIHRVADGDSLVSLSLNYGVSIPLIKKANGLTSEEIYYLKEIKIPNPKKLVYPKPPEELEKDRITTIRRAFKNRTGENSDQVVEEYLQATGFNYVQAVEKYESEKNIISARKKAIDSLKYQLDKEDRDDRIAQYYLECNGWNVKEAYQSYRDDIHHSLTGNSDPGHPRGNMNRPLGYHHPPTKLTYNADAEETLQFLNHRQQVPASGPSHIDRFTFDVSKKNK